VAAASAAARANAALVADRSEGAYAVLKGEAVARPRRKGKILLTLGILAAAAAAAAMVFKKSAPREDPWATPLEDPYTAPTSGRDSTAAARDKVASLADTAKEKASQAAEAAKEKASDAKDKAAGAAASAKDKVSSKSDEAGEKAADTVDDFSGNPDDTQGTTGTPGNIG
jgi:ElaB/YqjD/DUF883 family membrane-anchored ribosome-binding protein